MYIGLKIFTAILFLLCVFFSFMGVYLLDISLIIIGFLFGISIALVVLETRHELTNPFKKG